MILPTPASVNSPTEAIFWMALGLLVYVYVGYPLLLAAICLVVRRRRPEPAYTPSLSVLIAAYNEGKNIGRKIEQMLSLDYPADKIEVIVLSDCSTDRTNQIVSACADPRVRLLPMPQRRGKTHAQNEGVKLAKGEVLVFSDATTVYHPQALRYLACNYADPHVGAVSGRYQYFDPLGSSPTGLGSVAFWSYENLIKMMQSRIRTLTGCCGCIYSVRRTVYTPLAEDVISDLVQPLWAIQKGYRIAFEDRALAYEQTTTSTKDEFAMRVRVVTRSVRGILSVNLLLNPFKFGWVSFQLWSHKMLRWFVPLFLLLLFISSAALASRPGFAVLFALQIIFYAMALLTASRPLHRFWKPLALPLYFCTLNAAALYGLVEACRGRKYAVWETVRKAS